MADRLHDFERRWRDWSWRHLRREAHGGRWSAAVDLPEIPLPRVRVYGEGDDWAYAALSIGTAGADPIARVEVDLDGTRLGRLICTVCAAYRGWRYRLPREAPDPPVEQADSTHAPDEPVA